MRQTTVSARIPQSLNEALVAASQSEHIFRSEIIRRALRYYLSQNPDNLALDGKESGTHDGTDSSKNQQPDLGDTAVYDPIEEM